MLKLLDIGSVYRATVVRRLTRFEVLLVLNGERVVAHNTNTGRLNDVLVSGLNALLIPISGRKLKYRIVGVEVYEGLYCIIDTLTQEVAFTKALGLSLVPYLNGCRIVKRSPKFGNVIHDYLLNCGGEYVVVELKSAEFRGSRDEAMYPDCPTLRGRKHLASLIRLRSELGISAYLIFMAALPRPRCFMPFREADPIVDRLVMEALGSGVSVRGIAIFMDLEGRVYLESPDLPLCSEWLCTATQAPR